MSQIEHEKRVEASDKKRKELFLECQAKLLKEKFNLYKFELNLFNPEESDYQWNQFTAIIEFKKEVFCFIMPAFDNKYDFQEPTSISNFYVRVSHSPRAVLETINYCLKESGKKQIEIQRDHETIQSCIDEMEKIRLEIVQFYST